MTISLATIESELDDAQAESVAELVMGVDLSLLGAVATEAFAALGNDLPVEYASYPRIASCAQAAARGGIDFVCFDANFRTRSDNANQLDAARVAARLLTQHAGNVNAEIPAEAAVSHEGIGILAEHGNHASPTVEVTKTSDLEAIAKLAEEIADSGMPVNVQFDAEVADAIALDMLASFVDGVRVRTDDLERARDIRRELRSLAASNGRSLRVFGELGIVISGSMRAASERALLVADITGAPLFEGKASVVGTVYDVADAVERWVGTGAADGLIFLPASLPTDLASLIRGVVPLLTARARIEAA
jgi:hypothetical protein